MAQAQGPTNHRPVLQPFGLIGATDAWRIMPKGAPAMTAAIAIDPHSSAAYVPHRLSHLAPALEGDPFTIGTALRSFCLHPLDIRQLEHHNSHGELLAMAIFPISIIQGVRHIFKTHRLCDSHKLHCPCGLDPDVKRCSASKRANN